MRSHSFRHAALMLGGIALAGLAAFHLKADQWDKKTILTVNQPIQVTDTYLEPGTYVLRLHDSMSNRHVVQIFNDDQSHLINTVMAIPNERLRPTGNTQFAFWETPPGYAKAMRAWFYPGDNFGQEFRYPKNLRQIAVATTTAPPPPPEPQYTAPQAEQPPPPPPPPPQAAAQPEPQREEPVEIAQNTAPAPPPPPAQPETLPHTASVFPLVGLGGLLSLALFSFLRISRVS